VIFTQPDFLSDAEFNTLNKSMTEQCNQIKSQPNQSSTYNWIGQYQGLNDGDLTMVAMRFGKHVPQIINKISNYLNTCIDTVPKVSTVSYCYAVKEYEAPYHKGLLLSSTTQKEASRIYKAFIFAHKTWENTWGGKLNIKEETIHQFIPLSNLLVIFSLDHEYEVTKITDLAKDNTRMLFSVKFGKERV